MTSTQSRRQRDQRAVQGSLRVTRGQGAAVRRKASSRRLQRREDQRAVVEI